MDSSTTVSVIVPTRNRSHPLRRALSSLGAQTRPPDEIIVVDDGSTDATASWVPEEFPAVTFVRQEHAGVSAARNRGVRETSGEWIAFLDSDDEWTPRKLERQLEAISSTPDHAICHTDEVWIRNGKRVNPKHRHEKRGGHIFQHCLPLCAISPSSVLMKRSLFDNIGGFDETFPVCEDYDLWLRVCSRYPVLYVDEMLVVKYGGHADQLSKSYWGMDRFRIRALEKILQTDILSVDDRRAVLRMLLEKFDIYLQGARKRGKHDDVEDHEMRRAWYAKVMSALDESSREGDS